MPAHRRVKKTGAAPCLVGVISNRAELRLARRLGVPPDLFEIRLDCLARERNLDRLISDLPAPVIITARHPAEGGKNNLSARARRDLLLRFLPVARYVDIELRSVRSCRMVLERARRIGVRTIISFHNLRTTPSLGSLRAKAIQADRFRPAFFKVATRTDTASQLSRLLQFASVAERLPLCAMGIGRLGAISRLLLAQCGSVLVYTALNAPLVEGQPPLNQFRTMLRELCY